MLQIPTCAFFKSSSVSPMPYSIACAAGCVSSCVKTFEYLFSSLISILCYQLYYYYHLPLRRTLVLPILYSPIIPRRHWVTVLHSDLFVFLRVFVSLWFKKILFHKFHI